VRKSFVKNLKKKSREITLAPFLPLRSRPVTSLVSVKVAVIIGYSPSGVGNVFLGLLDLLTKRKRLDPLSCFTYLLKAITLCSSVMANTAWISSFSAAMGEECWLHEADKEDGDNSN